MNKHTTVKNCLSAIHRVYTRNGTDSPPRWRKIADLVADGLAGKSFELRTPDGWTTPTAFHRYENCPMYEVLTCVDDDEPREMVLCRATANHLMVLADGRLCQLRDLQPDVDEIVSFSPVAEDIPSLSPQSSPSLPVTGIRPFRDQQWSIELNGPTAYEVAYCFTLPGQKFATAIPAGPAHWTGGCPPQTD